MEFGEFLLYTLIKPLAYGVKAILPLGLKNKFEPDSIVGHCIGFGAFLALFAILLIGVRFYVIYFINP